MANETYNNDFVNELIEMLTHKEEWGLTADNIKIYEDGLTANGDAKVLAFIHDANIRYHKTESDVLIGNYIVITTGSSKIQNICRFEINMLYKKFQEGGWDAVWDIVQDNLKAIEQLRNSDVISLLNDYQAVKSHLIIRPINYTDHRLELKNCIYRRTGDIALVLYVIIQDSKERGLNTSKIQKNAFDQWKVDEDQVWEEALLNTYVLAPPRMYLNPMDTYQPPYERGAFMAIGNEGKKILPLQVPTITTTKQTNGAIALFYPGVKEKLAELANGSFYVAFTSIHDARIHCEGSISPRQVLQLLKHINAEFDPAEILSRKVFYYDAKTKDFSVLEL